MIAYVSDEVRASSDADAFDYGLLELEDVRRDYHLGKVVVPAICGISLRIDRGESVAVWGPSGSGKSTLLNLLGLLDMPTFGRLFVAGREIGEFTDNELTDFRGKKIGFVFQSFNLVPVLTALENVMLPLQVQGVAKHISRRRSRDWLDRVDMGSFAEFLPNQLSGGQRQRVAVARALVIEPMLIIADEPTANLDSKNSAAVIRLINEIGKDTGVTCIFSTHDQRLLDQIRRHIYLVDGLVREDRCREGRIGV